MKNETLTEANVEDIFTTPSVKREPLDSGTMEDVVSSLEMPESRRVKLDLLRELIREAMASQLSSGMFRKAD